ncbi:hypothetical protein EVAR_100432_1 [Eumeta japonica]|uniref:Uncharacterized protein n=1 Tax=Eumeta variegata TaxID=151549 RepID=A0A4C2A4N5_EUMVA|nr:hypothetical protein EVAR_100432_1 [Eumeta japonica]
MFRPGVSLAATTPLDLRENAAPSSGRRPPPAPLPAPALSRPPMRTLAARKDLSRRPKRNNANDVRTLSAARRLHRPDAPPPGERGASRDVREIITPPL